MSRRGFSMIEFLVSMTLLLIVITAGLEFFAMSRKLFFKVKTAEENTQAAFAALDKMRLDLIRGGRGLALPMELGLLRAVQADAEKLTILSAQGSFGLKEDAGQGDKRIALDPKSGLKRGDEICVLSLDKGEIGRVSTVAESALTLCSPLSNSYVAAETQVLELERISLYLDLEERTLRRKVNSSSAQPLLEDVGAFRFAYDASRNLAEINFTLIDHKERTYALCVFPKNAGFALKR